MLNMLIVNNDMKYIKKLISYTLKYTDNIRLFDVATSGKEALIILLKNNIDIILLEPNLPDLDGVGLIKVIEQQRLEIYNKSIIILSNDRYTLRKINNSPVIYSYQAKDIDKESLLKNINKFVRDKRIMENIDSKIMRELKFLNYNIAHIGTIYLKECIKIDFLKYNGEAENINKQIYPLIAEKYNKSILLIKNNIIKATNYMYNECEIEKLIKYFGIDMDYKPTPKAVIKTVISKI